MSLTPKQKNFLDFITQFTQENGYAPTLQDMADHFELSSLGTVQQYLKALESKGYLRRDAHAARAIHVVDPTVQESEYTLPVLGKVAAGRPIEYKKFDEQLKVPAQMLRSAGEHFVLQVKGDSMIDEGILDGDYVIIKKQEAAENHQIVVAQVEGEATIKRFVKKKDSVELHSANSKYKPIVIEKDQHFQIAGLYCGLIRIH